MDEDMNIANFNETLNPIIESFKKMMTEKSLNEYGKLFKNDLIIESSKENNKKKRKKKKKKEVKINEFGKLPENGNNEDDFNDGEAVVIKEEETVKEFISHFIESDAIIKCPGCMLLLTIDCQQHEIYENQFRAKFVENCRSDENESVICPIENKDNKKTRNAEIESSDVFNPVYCQKCDRELGRVDKKGVYYFFNVLPFRI